MPLPALIRAEFEHVDHRPPRKTTTSGTYYSILLGHAFLTIKCLFPCHWYILIVKVIYKATDSQVAPTTSSRDALAFVLYFCVYFHSIRVSFVLEVDIAIAMVNLSSRAAADNKMGLKLRQLFDQNLSELHGISALGVGDKTVLLLP